MSSQKRKRQTLSLHLPHLPQLPPHQWLRHWIPRCCRRQRPTHHRLTRSSPLAAPIWQIDLLVSDAVGNVVAAKATEMLVMMLTLIVKTMLTLMIVKSIG